MKYSVLLLLALATVASAAVQYRGYKVVSVRPRTPDEVSVVEHLVEKLDLDVWSHAKHLGGAWDVMVPPRYFQGFMSSVQRQHIPSRIKIYDVQKVIDEQEVSKKASRAFDHTSYHNLEDIYAILDTAANDFPSLVSVYNGGTTYEGRDIRITKVSSGGTKPAMWIDCGIHAREWVSTATCQYIIDQLSSGYGTDSDMTRMLDTYDFHILVSTNPDGYAYTWSDDRVWRKNRVPFGGDLDCHGTDPNRNFDSNFGGPGTSDSPCSNTYHGPSAFSEFESQAVRDAVVSLNPAIFFTIHSYSQYWMVPYGYDSSLPANYDEQMRVTNIGVAALEAVYGTQYVSGNIADVIYLASGGSSDWAYDAAGVQYAFALELRDTGTYGFLLPADQILPTAEETWAGIVAAIDALP